MIAVITPDRIVIGGGISAAGDLLSEPIWAGGPAPRPHHLARTVTLVAAELGYVGGLDRRGRPRGEQAATS